MIHVFIINPYAGNGSFSSEIRDYLSKRKDIEYFIFHTREAGSESNIAREVMNLFEGEKIRIYCCGGSGTMMNTMNGVADLSKVEFAFYPKGLSNDFLKVFGDDRDKFNDLGALIDGQSTKIDYIETNGGVCLNSFSVGLDSSMGKKMEDFKAMSVFGKIVPYVMGFIYAAFVAKSTEMEVTVDGEKHVGKFKEIFFGNGCVIGGMLWFEDKSDITDGRGRIVLFKDVPPFKILSAVNKLRTKKIDKTQEVEFKGYTEEITIKRSDNRAFVMNYDGDFISVKKEFTAKIVQKGLNFVLPKGVELK